MSDTVKIRFDAKPGKYPDHKGGRTWLHDRGGARKVSHAGGKDGYTVKMFPRIIWQSGTEHDVPEQVAKTLCKRYTCFTLVSDKGVADKSSTEEAKPLFNRKKGDSE